jgi:hypothetical protein
MSILTAFEGSWRLIRRIDDHFAGVDRIFVGRADLIRRPEGLRYFETGHWTKSDWQGLTATRTYFWREVDGRIAVDYEDGRPFHTFEVINGGEATSSHDCDPDRYDVTYRFDLPSRWAAEWRVSGPKKDYVSESEYILDSSSGVSAPLRSAGG